MGGGNPVKSAKKKLKSAGVKFIRTGGSSSSFSNPFKSIKKQVKRSTKQVSKQVSRSSSQVAAEAKRAKDAAVAETRRVARKLEEETRRVGVQIGIKAPKGAGESTGPNSMNTTTLDGGETSDEGESEDKGKKKTIGKKRKIGKKGAKINKVPLKAAGGVKI